MENDLRPSVKTRFKSFMIQCTRVWQILKKPSSDEFRSVAKISALGILAMGAIGFILSDLIKVAFK